MEVLRLRRGFRRGGIGIALLQPAGRRVVRVEADLPLALGALLSAAMGEAMPQALTSSFSFSASAITFCATCDGTSSYRVNDMW
jgi:hypothetical protein